MADQTTRPASGARSFSPYRYWLAPFLREEVVSYLVPSPRLTEPLRVAVLSDFHAGTPFMPISRVARIVATTQEQEPDLILLTGDFRAAPKGFQRPVPMTDLARELAGLCAPLGRYAVFGNHDWWDHPQTQIDRAGPVPYAEVLEAAGIPVLSNSHVTLTHGSSRITLAGLESQEALRGPTRDTHVGLDDLQATLAGAPEECMTLLMAHEPWIFARIPHHDRRIDLTVSGHNHAGQIQIFGRPLMQTLMRDGRFLHGHFTENDRHLIVSGGLGCSRLPLRLGAVPEITRIDLVPA